MIHSLVCRQSGRKTKRASGSSSSPKNISCTLCLSHLRHNGGHGSPHKPIPIYRENVSSIRRKRVRLKSYKDDHILIFVGTVHCMEDDHMVPNITEYIEGVYICKHMAERKGFKYSKGIQLYASNLFACCA